MKPTHYHRCDRCLIIWPHRAKGLCPLERDSTCPICQSKEAREMGKVIRRTT